MYSMSSGRLWTTKLSTRSSASWSLAAGGPLGKSRGPSFEFHSEDQYGVPVGFRAANRFPDARGGTSFEFPLKMGMFSSPVFKEVAHVLESVREGRFDEGLGRNLCSSDEVPCCEEHEVVLGFPSPYKLSGFWLG